MFAQRTTETTVNVHLKYKSPILANTSILRKPGLLPLFYKITRFDLSFEREEEGGGGGRRARILLWLNNSDCYISGVFPATARPFIV